MKEKKLKFYNKYNLSNGHAKLTKVADSIEYDAKFLFQNSLLVLLGTRELNNNSDFLLMLFYLIQNKQVKENSRWNYSNHFTRSNFLPINMFFLIQLIKC